MKLYKAIQKSKYVVIMKGVMFALLSIPFIVWGIKVIMADSTYYMDILYPFVGILICLILGSYSMFHQDMKPNYLMKQD